MGRANGKLDLKAPDGAHADRTAALALKPHRPSAFPGRAHADGCSRSQPCWVASAFHPERQCGEVQDDAVCLRGWGAFGSEEECCMPGNGHSQGCGVAGDFDQL